jgi:hypothetical protein
VGEEKPPGLLLCSHGRASFMRGGLIRRQVGNHGTEAVFLGDTLGETPLQAALCGCARRRGASALGRAALLSS